MLRVRARDNSCFVALCNMVGGQDELIFDGSSVVFDDEGELVARARELRGGAARRRSRPGDARSGAGSATSAGGRSRATAREAPAPVELELAAAEAPDRPPPPDPGDAARRSRADAARARARPPRLRRQERLRRRRDRALRRDRLGADRGARGRALGADRVHGVSMPSRYSSDGDARRRGALAESLGIDFREIAIEPMVEAFTGALAPAFAGREPDLTEENLQARIRGTLLMALSNKFGWLVIATGNKSELSVGYSTLYGDLAGGFALIKDVYKTDVFRLCAAAQRARRARADPAARSSSAPRAPSCAPTSSTRTRCRRTRSSTACSRPTSSSTAPARSSPRTASSPRSSSARSR